jgi:hypothetical protein
VTVGCGQSVSVPTIRMRANLSTLGIGWGRIAGSPIGCDPVRPPLPSALPGGSTRIYPDRSGLIRIAGANISRTTEQTQPRDLGDCSGSVPSGGTADQTSCAVSRHRRISLRSIRASSRTLRLRIPCRRAFLALATLPRSVFGPHDRSHGFQFRMSAACRARRSGVQPLLMA